MTPEQWQEIKVRLHAAIELEPARRDAYVDEITETYPELREEIQSLLASYHEMKTDFLGEAVDKIFAVGEHECFLGHRLGPYHIVEQIGLGGMGEVFRAVRADDEFEKQVAIKLVRVGVESAFVVTRFKNERQILANLDHPNIARLLDGGTTEAGVPYFVMELVEGETIDQYCSHQELAVAARLNLFLQVCSAVQYAHQRLIVHRDIKPANILVTSEGVPKLLDFGIAKILDPGAVKGVFQQTKTVFQIMTPGYASPEQIKGDPITTTSDVYSLGVVLYELLTDHHPYRHADSTPQEIANAVCELEPQKPSTVVHGEMSRQLQGDLDNIILMALRKEPERRYPSVEQFAEDILRHLRNLPVLARRDTLSYRTSKFMMRHKAGVAATLAVTLALVLGMVVTLREARIAERRFNDVRSLANSLMFDVHDSIRDLPGSTAARKVIVENALKYLDSLAQESRNDAGLQRELAAGYKRIGDVQGYQFSANMGETASALVSYKKALVIRKRLFASHPSNLDDALAFSESLQDVAETLLAVGDTTGALANIRVAVETTEPLERTHPNDVKVLAQLRDNYEAEADILAGNFNLSNLGEASTALIYREKELQSAERISAMQPNDPNIQRSTAVTLTRMGDQLLLNGRWHEALDYYLRAQKSFENLAARSPNARVLDNLHGVYTRLQQNQMWNGKPKEAVATNRKALELSKKMSFSDPSNSYEKLVVAGDYGNLADSLSRAGVKQESISFVKPALDLTAELVKHNPTNMEYLGMQAAEYVTAGDVCRRFSDYRQAQRYYREALAISEKIQAADPNNADVRLRIAAIDTELGLTLLRAGDLDAAVEAYNQALQIIEPQITSSHPSEEALYATANAYAGMGEIETALASDKKLAPGQQRAHWEKARSWYKRSLELWSEVKEPGDVSPEGFEPVLPATVGARLAELNGRVPK